MAKRLSIEKKGNFSGLSASDLLKKNKILETQVDDLKKKSFRIVPLTTITQQEPFKSLFPIEEKVFLGILSAIRSTGFDHSKPVDIWKGIVIDGNTRFKAALEAGIDEIPVFEHSFRDAEEALEYAVHNQRDRRNITDAEIYGCLELLDKRREHGGDRKSDHFKCSSDHLKSRDRIAGTIGTSGAKVQKIRTIREHGDKETIDSVKKGELSINKAYNRVREKRIKHKQSDIGKSEQAAKLQIILVKSKSKELLAEYKSERFNKEHIVKELTEVFKKVLER